MAAVLARFRQGFTALLLLRNAAPMPPEYRPHLPAAVVDHWNARSPYDQRHLISVATDLRENGQPRDLVLAGLLHDIGKPAHVPIVARVVVVLMDRFPHSVKARVRDAKRPPLGLSAIRSLLNHAENGANLLASHNVSPAIVWLVRHHEDALSNPWLTALRDADNHN